MSPEKPEIELKLNRIKDEVLPKTLELIDFYEQNPKDFREITRSTEYSNVFEGYYKIKTPEIITVGYAIGENAYILKTHAGDLFTIALHESGHVIAHAVNTNSEEFKRQVRDVLKGNAKPVLSSNDIENLKYMFFSNRSETRFPIDRPGVIDTTKEILSTLLGHDVVANTTINFHDATEKELRELSKKHGATSSYFDESGKEIFRYSRIGRNSEFTAILIEILGLRLLESIFKDNNIKSEIKRFTHSSPSHNRALKLVQRYVRNLEREIVQSR